MSRWLVCMSTCCAVSCATTPKDLVYPISRGDSLQHVLDRNIAQIDAFVAGSPALRGVVVNDLTEHLMESRPDLLLVDLGVGKQLVVSPLGALQILGANGLPAPLRITGERLSNVASRLRAGPDDEIHKRLAQAVVAAGLKPKSVTLGVDGKSVQVGETTFRLGTGMTVVGGHSHFHIVGKEGEESFTVSVWPVDEVFSFPENPFFYVTDDNRIESKHDTSWEIKRLLSEGQIMEHDGRYHLTRAFAFEPWQQLVTTAASEDLPPVQRRLAAEIEAALIANHFALSDVDFSADLEKTKTRIGRSLAALERGMTGPQLTFVVQFNASLEEEGHLLRIDDQVIRVGDGLRFGFCRHHVHVMDERHLGVNVAIRPPGMGEKLTVPPNAFVIAKDGQIEMRELSPETLEILKRRWIEPAEHAYQLTERINPVALQELRAAATDDRLSGAQKEKFSTKIAELMAAELPTDSEQDLVDAVKDRGKSIASLHKELQRLLRKRRR
ncbi:MAG: hypothetical protein A2289_04510 [Deltaproteobacteria bacterium RIFOXYA12_FULL_58_15]|nr:MAG: hypothetical protein A2289_04510 [Deltaproteobacteria bacterium RIFOXYA12_FULL_58_15]